MFIHEGAFSVGKIIEVQNGKIKECLTNAVIVPGRAEAIRVGQRKPSFSSKGDKLLDLLTGLEGTLGIITDGAGCSPPRGVWSGTTALPVGLHWRSETSSFGKLSSLIGG
jgi:hypothetical protein